MDKQEAPFTIKVGMTEGCCLYCKFCGIHGIRKSAGDYKFLSVEDATVIAKAIAKTGWKSKIEFTLYGEPTMNPNHVEIIKTFRRHLPNTQMMLTSNGGGIQKNPYKKLEAIFDAGLNVFALDNYKHANLADKVIEDVCCRKSENKECDIEVLYYPEGGSDASPHRRRSIDSRVLVVIKDISTGVDTRKLSNHCGSAGPLDNSFNDKRCARPFRELVIDHNRKVRICCNDWRGVLDCGTCKAGNLERVWNNMYFQAVRKMLYHKQRTFPPCKGCNSISYRVGFLPDKMGKESMDYPSPDDMEIIHDALSNPPLVKPVPRPWETGEAHGLEKYIKSED